MIQIYSKKNTNFSKNGDAALTPDETSLSVELNGAWALNLHHPIDKNEKWKYLEENAVLKAPSFNGDQLFRIYNRGKSDSGISVQAYPIFFDAKDDCFLTDARPTGKNGQQALDIMCAANKKYSAESNIKKATTAYYQYTNLINAINGDESNAFINRWGGEILYDNYKVIINERVGGDYGVELLYGKNIKADGLTEEIDMSDVVTRIYPKAYNGHKMSGNGYIDSPLISNYPTIKATTITFADVKMREDAQEDDKKNGVIICSTQAELDAALRQRCQEKFSSGIDKPRISISADMILLQDTDQYKDYKVLETVSLGDTIHCRHSKLGIVTDARVIALEYDCIQKRVISVELGDFKNNYFDKITSSADKVESIVNPDGSIMAEKVQGVLDGIYTQLKLQSTVAKKVNGRAFTVEDLDPDSPLYGCMVWGTQGLQIATKRTADGKDWDWTTAITAQGIVANAVITGLLSDKTGKNFWNLDTGEFQLSSTQTIVDGQPLGSYLEGIKAFAIRLSNDFQSIPTDHLGNYKEFPEVSTVVYANFGKDDISVDCTYKLTQSKGVTGSWDNEKRIYHMTGLSEDSGYVDIEASYLGIFKAFKRFNVTKQKSGVPGLQGIQGEKGEDGIPGPPGEDGADGKTSYTHIAYANSADGTKDFSVSDSNREYIGQYTDFTQNDSTNPAKYSWSRIKGDKGDQGLQGLQGEKGEQGIPGKNGADGKTTYFHIKYAPVQNPTASQMTETPNVFIGTYVDFTETDSPDPKKYTWSRFEGIQGSKGEQGIPGKNGSNGQTSYLHIAYANSADGSQGFSVSDSINKLYIGQYTDFIQADSTDYRKYSWSRIKGDKGDQGIPGPKGEPGTVSRNYMLESSDAVIKKAADNQLTPEAVTFKAFYRDGNAASRTAYAGRFKIEESANGTSFTVKYTSAANESVKSYAPSSAEVKIIRCTLYAAGGTTNALDTQTVVVLTDASNLEVGSDNLVSKDDVQGLYGTVVKRNGYTFDISGTSHKEDGNYRGVFIPETIFTVGESYVFSYKFAIKSGSVTKIGGHSAAFEPIKAVVDGVEYTSKYDYGYPLDSKKTEHTVTVYLKYLGNGTDKKLYIQPNRQGGPDTSWNILLKEVQVRRGNTKTDWQPSIKDSLSGVQIGGRNLIVNSTFNRQDYKWVGTDRSAMSYPKEGRDGSYCAKIIGKFNTSYNLTPDMTYKVKPGETYTLSGWTKSKDIVKGATNYFVTLYMGFYDKDHKWKAEASINNGQMPLSSEWERNVLTCTVPDVSGIDHMWVYLYARDFTGTLWWDDIQLEKANKVSDWSPAPEDSESLIITLSNEAHTITTDKNGNGGNFADCETTVQVYNGTQDVTAQTTYTVTKSSGITGTWDNTNHKYKITALSTDNGYVDIKAVYNGISVVKRFTVSKSKTGATGATGADGKTSYFHIKYSSVANPTSSSQMTETPNTYIGTYVDFIQADSTDPKKYTWYRFQGLQGPQGTQGIPGKNGINGQTSYLHLKYSNDGGKTFTANTGETPGDYIGQYVDFTQADSTDPKRYSWSKTKGETGRTYFIELSANILKRKQNNRILPISVSAKAFYRDGTSATRTAYAGRWKIETSTNGVDYTTVASSTVDESSKSYRVETLAANIVSVRFALYAAGGFTTPLDMQSIPIVIDVDSLTHEQIFNLLTNNGAMKGIYQSGGQLYINGTYIRSLILTADMIQGKELASLGATLGGFIVESKRIRNTSSDGKKAMYMGSYDWNNSDFLVVQNNASGSWKNLLMLKYDGSLESRDSAQTALAQLNAGGLKFRSKDGNSWADDMVFNKNGMEGKRNKYCKVSVKADNADTLTSGAAAGWERNVLGDTRVYGELEVKTLKTTGTKKIVKQTPNYGEASFYCDETPTPLLSDYGEGTIASDGLCYVDIDDIFREAVNSNIQYFVFLQKEGPGDCWVKEREATHFVVQGTPDLRFTWGIKVKQKGTEHLRFSGEEQNLRIHSLEPETVMEAEQEEATQQENEAMEQYTNWMFQTIKEMEERYNEEIDIIYES